MFYRDIFSHDDGQRMIHLRQNFIIRADVPEYLRNSQCIFKPMFTQGAAERNTAPLPIYCVSRLSEGQRIIRDMIENDNIGVNNDNLAQMFRVGVSVPKQPQIAEYLEKYDPLQDENKAALQLISDVIDKYVDTYTKATGQSEYCFPAPYLAKLLDFESFISTGEGENRIKVPDGIPVLAVYYADEKVRGQFNLADAFSFESGRPMPYAHVMLRNYFDVPKVFESKALSRRSSFIFVFGMLSHTAEFSEIVNGVGMSPAPVYLDKYPDLQSAAYKKLRTGKRTSKYESNIEREALKCLRTYTGGTQFVAIDCAYLNRETQLVRGVQATLSQTETLLARQNFTTRKETVNKRTVSHTGKSRRWSL